jgi:probable addiction module antidote protein
MTRKTRSFRELRTERLANPEVAAHYLNVTLENSPTEFLSALRNVAQARQMAKVAKEAGVQRETLYRSLSEQGNPTWDTLRAVLTAVGISVKFVAEGAEEMISPPASTSQPLIANPEIIQRKPINFLGGGTYQENQAWSGVNPLFARQETYSDQAGLR